MNRQRTKLRRGAWQNRIDQHVNDKAVRAATTHTPQQDPPNAIQVDDRLQKLSVGGPATVLDDRLSSTLNDDRPNDGEQGPSRQIINRTYDMSTRTQLDVIPKTEGEIPTQMIEEADEIMTNAGQTLPHSISLANVARDADADSDAIRAMAEKLQAMDERVRQLERQNETLKQRINALERRSSARRSTFDMNWEPKNTLAAVKKLNDDLAGEANKEEFLRFLLQKMAAAGSKPKDPLVRLLHIIINRDHLRSYTHIRAVNGKQPLAKLGCLRAVIERVMQATYPDYNVQEGLTKGLNSFDRHRYNNKNQNLLTAKTFIESDNNCR